MTDSEFHEQNHDLDLFLGKERYKVNPGPHSNSTCPSNPAALCS